MISAVAALSDRWVPSPVGSFNQLASAPPRWRRLIRFGEPRPRASSLTGGMWVLCLRMEHDVDPVPCIHFYLTMFGCYMAEAHYENWNYKITLTCALQCRWCNRIFLSPWGQDFNITAQLCWARSKRNIIMKLPSCFRANSSHLKLMCEENTECKRG